MKREDFLRFKEQARFFLRRKNGFHYEAKLLNVTNDSVTIQDKYKTVYTFDMDEIAEISEWKDD